MIDVPWRLRKEASIKSFVAHYFLGYITIDESTINPMKWSREVKMVVNVNVEEPLKPGFIMGAAEGRPDQTITFQYERLQEVCIYCGRIGHELKGCKERAEHLAEGYDGIPTGEYSNLKANVPFGHRLAGESEDTTTGSYSRERPAGWPERSGSSSGSFSTPSLRSPGTANTTPSPGRSSTRSSMMKGKEPLSMGPAGLSPKFHLFFPDVPGGNQKSSPIRPINLQQLFEGGIMEDANGRETLENACLGALGGTVDGGGPTNYNSISPMITEPMSPTPLFPPGYGPRMAKVREVGGPSNLADPRPPPDMVVEKRGLQKHGQENGPNPSLDDQSNSPTQSATELLEPEEKAPHPSLPLKLQDIILPPNFSLGPFPFNFSSEEQEATRRRMEDEATKGL
ncbi:hypothetical protein LINGRAHAP2_LOCUS30740 [Linum grandiflorum]